MIAGVCGGIAETMGWSPGIVRLLFVLISLFTTGVPGTIVYLILWLIIPEEGSD
jgi:phage shock protein C